MEPFTLHCTTCRARLKVKDESVVGSILNCPRCGSMVHVVPPVDWKSPESAAAGAAGGSNRTTESSITLSLPLSSAVAAASAPLPPAPPTLPKAVASTTPAAAPPPPATTAEPPIAADAVVAPINASWLSIAATWLRGDGLIWAGGLAAGVVVGAVTWLVMTSFTSGPPVATEASPIQVARADANTAAENSVGAPAAESAPSTQAAAPTPVAASPPQVTAAATEKEPQPSATQISVEAPQVAETPPGDQPLEEASSTSDAPAPTEPTTPIADREPSLKLDPSAAPADASTPDDAVVEALIGPESAAEPSAADAPDASADLDQPTGRPAQDDSGAMTQEDVDSALAVRLSEVKFVAAPLAQFVEFIADTSALAISVDDAALAKVGKRRTMPLSVHLNDTTAREALEAAIAPLGLVCELRGNRLFVTVPADATNAAK